MTAAAQTAAPAERPAVLTLLAEFCSKPGCEKYSGDSAKIKLVETYLWLRQLTDQLTFERFLEKYALVADFDETNRKHPADAIAFHCPRVAAEATKRNVPQWTAKEAVDIAALYVDVVRAAEDQGIAVPLTLDQYLAMDGPAYKRGEIEPPPPAKTKKKRASTSGAARGTGDKATEAQTGVIPRKTLPTAVGQTVIYELRPRAVDPNAQGPGGVPLGQQFKGVVTAMQTVDDKTYVSFRTFEGEDFFDLNVNCFTVIEETPPAFPNAERLVFPVSDQDWQRANGFLILGKPVEGAEPDAVLHAITQNFAGGKYAIDVNVSNGDRGPYVDSQLINLHNNDHIDGTLQPRRNLFGEYRYETPDHGWLVLEVRYGGG